MSEDERIGILILIGVALVCASIVAIVWHAYDERTPLTRERHDRQIEEIRACAHAIDVTSCLRDATN